MNERYQRWLAGRPLSARAHNREAEASERHDRAGMPTQGFSLQTPMGQQLQPMAFPTIWLKITSADTFFTPTRYGGYEVLQDLTHGYEALNYWVEYTNGYLLPGGAAATAEVVDGVVVALHLVGGGSGYASAPAVVFTGDGSGATGHCTIDKNGTITGIVLDDGGSGYTSAPAVGFNTGRGSGYAIEVNDVPTDIGTVVRIVHDSSGEFWIFSRPGTPLTTQDHFARLLSFVPVNPDELELRCYAMPMLPGGGGSIDVGGVTDIAPTDIINSDIGAGEQTVTPDDPNTMAYIQKDTLVLLMGQFGTPSEFVRVTAVSSDGNSFTATFLNDYSGNQVPVTIYPSAGYLVFSNGYVPCAVDVSGAGGVDANTAYDVNQETGGPTLFDYQPGANALDGAPLLLSTLHFPTITRFVRLLSITPAVSNYYVGILQVYSAPSWFNSPSLTIAFPGSGTQVILGRPTGTQLGEVLAVVGSLVPAGPAVAELVKVEALGVSGATPTMTITLLNTYDGDITIYREGVNVDFASASAAPTEADVSGPFRFHCRQELSRITGNPGDGRVFMHDGDRGFTPGQPSDWNGSPPTTLQAAIDRCAALLIALNGGTGP